MGIDAHITFQPLKYASLAARASYFPRSVGTVANPSQGGIFSLVAAGAAVCAGPRLPVAVCLGPEVDVMRGEGFGVLVNGEGSKAWLSFFADGRARIAITRHFGIVAMASLIVPTKRQTFALDGVGPVHRPSAAAGRGALGLEVFF
jgi:hypothetical protein